MTSRVSDDRLQGLVLGTLPPLAAERLAALDAIARFVSVDDAGDADREAAEVLFVWDFRSTTLGAIVDTLPSLRWLHASSAGVEKLLVPAVVNADFVVTNSAGLFDEPIAEYVAALVLAHAKELPATLQAQADHRWSYREVAAVAGTTMVIVGMGRIGRAVGRLARALGMEVIGVRRSTEPLPDDPPGARVTSDLAAVAPLADYLVVTAALTPATRGLVSAAIVDALRPSAYLINVARSPIVDTDAVVAALRDGRLAGATLDVFDQEPLPPDSELWDVPNLLVSPHMSGDTIGFTGGIVDVFGENVRRYLRREPLANVVDVRRGY
jgi:phosphoglycerate dehydrogenase-like enzyme